MEEREKRRCPDELSTNILPQQLLRESLNARPEGKGSGGAGKAQRVAELRCHGDAGRGGSTSASR